MVYEKEEFNLLDASDNLPIGSNMEMNWQIFLNLGSLQIQLKPSLWQRPRRNTPVPRTRHVDNGCKYAINGVINKYLCRPPLHLSYMHASPDAGSNHQLMDDALNGFLTYLLVQYTCVLLAHCVTTSSASDRRYRILNGSHISSFIHAAINNVYSLIRNINHTG